MMYFKGGPILLLLVCSWALVYSKSAGSPRSLVRVHIPWLGLGPTCKGCPQHFCDDDPAIIHGYCCGCAKYQDNLPVQCAPHLECPANTYSLCEDYEYMMYCCC